MADQDAAPAEGGGVTIEIDPETAAEIYAVGEMLRKPIAPEQPGKSLEELVAASGAPMRLSDDPASGRKLVASRIIARGEVILEETATAWALSRSPGSEGVMTMWSKSSAAGNGQGRVITTLHPWACLRTLRDTLTLAPQFGLHAALRPSEQAGQVVDRDAASLPELTEQAYALLYQLSAYGRCSHAADGWGAVPEVPPGVEEREDNRVPPRVQLLHAIAQCNAFSAFLPEDDSEWKRALLWPMIGRLQVPEDRERLFEDSAPFSVVQAFFVLGALFNHACGWGEDAAAARGPGPSANVRYTSCRWVEGEAAPRVTFVAARDIAEGEELLHSYLDSTLPVEERRHKLLMTYRFACRCGKCAAEEPAAAQGGEDDPLAGHFPHGAGLSGTHYFFGHSGAYPPEHLQPTIPEDAAGEGEGEEAGEQA